MVEYKQNDSWKLLIAIALMGLLINIDYTAVNLALVPMATAFFSKINKIQWVLSGYILAWSAFVLPAGKSIDIYGSRRICLFGLLLFLLSSLIAGFAHSQIALVFGRFLQGIAGAFYVPSLYGLIFSYFPRNRRGFATGILSLGVGTGMAMGPTFGGLILTWLNWRWIFFINLPIVLFVMLIISTLQEQHQRAFEHETIDKWASLTLVLAILSFMYAISQITLWGILSLQFFALCSFTFLMCLLFILRQKYLTITLISWSLFKNRSYIITTIALACEQFSFATLIVIISLFLQKVMSLNLLDTSLVFFALTLMFGIVSPFSGRLVDIIGIKPLAIIGMLILMITTICFASLTSNTALGIIISILLVMGVGMGLAFSSLNTGVVTTVNEQEIGIASSVFLMFALLANTVGIITSTLVYELVGTQYLVKFISQQSAHLDDLQLTQLNHAIAYIGFSKTAFSAFSQQLQAAILKTLPIALNRGIDAALLISTTVTFLGVLLLTFLTRKTER